MNGRKIHNDYFLKKARSKINIKKKKNTIPINIINNRNNKCELYKEEINYNIDSTKTIESKQQNDESISIYNKKSMSINKSSNSHQFNTINIHMKSNSYVRNLENQIKTQKKQLNQLLEYKNICEKRIKSLSPDEVLPLTIDSLNPNFYSIRSEKNIKNTSRVINTSYSYKHSKLNQQITNYGKTLDMDAYTNNEEIYKNKYINLYRKYIQIIKENKKYSINTIKLQNTIDKLKSENEYILNLYENEKEKNLENINESDLDEKAKEWKEQAEIFRKDLVLSQAMVHSLKSEIEIRNKNKLNKKEISDGNNRINYLMNGKKQENNNLINENNALNKTLSDKNTLISNLLEENYKLNELLKSIGIININDYNNLKHNSSNKPENNVSLIKEMKDIIRQYENKFGYFNEYIHKIKNEINILYKDIKEIVNNNIFEKKNEGKKNKLILSDHFYQEINNIKTQIKDINIDLYNLDYSNDIKCIDNYKQLMKLILEELNKLILINKNIDMINDKEKKSINDLLILSKNLISNDNKIDTLISNQEKEIEKKKKSLMNNSNIRKTYYISNHSENKSKNRLITENRMKNFDDYNYTNCKKSKKIVFRNNKSFDTNKYFNTYKISNNYKDKIIFI